MTETTIAPTKAATRVETSKPLINVPKYQNKTLLITSEKRPRVKILRGKVKTLIIGLINILNKVRQAPTTKATQIGSTIIPEIIFVVTKTETEIKTQFKIIFILFLKLNK